ncbi:MAG TPA: hypothetical protein VGF35_01860, partial [Steroidobacteraceae bacterium]
MTHRTARARNWSSYLGWLLLLVLPGLALAAAAPTAPVHAWETGGTPASLEAWVNQQLAASDAAVKRLLAVKGARAVDNTLQPYDEAFGGLTDAQSQSALLYGVGATKELRDKAQALTQTAAAALAALSLNRDVYQALTAIPSPGDPGTRHYLERTLLEYRLAGVDRDDATRAKIKVLQDKITE